MTNPSLVEEIFLAALEKTPEERLAYLDASCKDDSELRAQVERLIDAHPKVAGFLDAPAAGIVDRTVHYQQPVIREGVVISGRYKLLEQIGAGGMGEVWMADQCTPIKRRVAVKLIKAGLDSRNVLSRFEAERQALAVMDHPNIAKVLDAGSTDEGRPYFVMELVKGVPITTFCDTRKLSPKERLALFIPVCQAIQHAHQKGVIHRDIKPGNLLVELHDDKPVPKVIDFGLAKAVGQPLTEHTLFTGFGSLVGTPTYMAPEQANFNAVDIDTRADVYALGILLYELLAGSPPLEPEQFKKAALDEVLRMIREDEPPRPSQRLSSSEMKASIAAVRGSEPAKLTAQIQGELDWIVMKALEKNRTRRYESASALAKDVENFLNGEAVLAHPPSTVYRFAKFARKHRVGLTTALLFAGLLISSAVLGSWLAVRARRAEGIAEEKRMQAEASAKAEALAAAEASDLLGAAMELKADSDLETYKARVDLALIESNADPRLGLLRLVSHLQTNPEGFQWKNSNFNTFRGVIYPAGREDLDEFVTAAVISLGQNFAPLLLPIRYGGGGTSKHPGNNSPGPDQIEINPKHPVLLTLGRDCAARLWDLRTASLIAELREGNEQIVRCGFSKDGNIAYTDSLDGSVRIWGCIDGEFQSKTEPRPERWKDSPENAGDFRDYGLSVLLTSSRILTFKVVPWGIGPFRTGNGASIPCELFNRRTGQFIQRLDMDGDQLEWDECDESPDGRLLVVKSHENEDSVSKFMIASTEDGKTLGQVTFPADQGLKQIVFSPSGRLMTVTYRRLPGDGHKSDPNSWILSVWNTKTWNSKPESSQPVLPGLYSCWNDELVARYATESGSNSACILYQLGRQETLARFETAYNTVPKDNRVLSQDGHRVLDITTRKELEVPKGRRFHKDLELFTSDGRLMFVSRGNPKLTDIVTGKEISAHPGYPHHKGFGLVPDLGFFSVVSSSAPADWPVKDATIQLIPTMPQIKMAISEQTAPDKSVLELWVQVAVRGELSEDGTFVKWDEKTWERKRQELASQKKLNFGSRFPFPGRLATDKLHWLRREFIEAEEPERPVFAEQLLDRSLKLGDEAEAEHWKNWLKANSRPGISAFPSSDSYPEASLRFSRPVRSSNMSTRVSAMRVPWSRPQKVL